MYITWPSVLSLKNSVGLGFKKSTNYISSLQGSSVTKESQRLRTDVAEGDGK